MSEQAPRSSRRAAAGPGAVLSTALRLGEMGLARGLDALAHVNQVDGFDCPGCAWPEALPRHRFEFCENGAKAVAHEATRKRVTRALFARKSVGELAKQAIQRTLEESLPVADQVLSPPWAEEGDDFELFGYTLDETREFAGTCLMRRLKVIGLG